MTYNWLIATREARLHCTNQTEVHDISILCAKAFGMDKLRDNFIVYVRKASLQRGYRSENQCQPSIKQTWRSYRTSTQSKPTTDDTLLESYPKEGPISSHNICLLLIFTFWGLCPCKVISSGIIVVSRQLRVQSVMNSLRTWCLSFKKELYKPEQSWVCTTTLIPIYICYISPYALLSTPCHPSVIATSSLCPPQCTMSPLCQMS